MAAFKITKNYETGNFIRKKGTFRKLFLQIYSLTFTCVTLETKPWTATNLRVASTPSGLPRGRLYKVWLLLRHYPTSFTFFSRQDLLDKIAFFSKTRNIAKFKLKASKRGFKGCSVSSSKVMASKRKGHNISKNEAYLKRSRSLHRAPRLSFH